MKTNQINKAHHQVNTKMSKDLKKKSKKFSRKVIMHYFKDYKLHIALVCFMAIIATLANTLAILGMSDLTEKLITLFSATQSTQLVNFMIFATVLIIFYIINALFTFLLNFIVVTLSQKIGAKLRLDLFSKIQSLSVQYFDTHESGDIMSVLTNDVYNIVLFLSQNFGQLIMGFISLLGMLIIMFLVSPYLALISLGLFPVMIIVILLIGKKSQKTFTHQQQSLGKINGFLEEMISGQNVVNLFNQEKKVIDDFQNLNNKLNEYGEKAQSVSGIVIPWNIFMSNLIILICITLGVFFSIPQSDGSIIGFGSEVLGVAGPGLVTAFLLSLRNFNQPITQMMGMVAGFQSAVAGTKRVENIFNLNGEINENEIIDVKNLTGKIEIKNLNFSYVEGKQILKNVSLQSKPGETIAIIGPTGSGKSTIINLLTKFYDIKDGDIFLDGYDIKKISKQSIRNEVSIVLQDTYLFSGSIKENIRYAKKDATDQEIINAAKTADCHNFIMQLENGYDFILSENAQELSQGQKQLVAIARALISPSNILILDEATSNIDTRTEIIVQKAMLELIKNKTSFVIAHRLSTIKKANKIIALCDGEVIEIGNHKELIAKKGFYYKMYNSQFNEEN
ncbi:MAG: ABC transporter ATP-binding protein [Malacoplasma sp.]